MTTYIICDSHGDAITAGIQGFEVERMARRLADERAESVWYSVEDDETAVPVEVEPHARVLSYRAITRDQSHWIGNAAAVAGGYVAVEGPRIARISAARFAEIVEDAEAPAPHAAARGWREEAKAQCHAYRHRLQGGDRAAVAGPEHFGGDFVLCVPDGGPFHDTGYSLPASLIEELEPLLRAAGYAIQET